MHKSNLFSSCNQQTLRCHLSEHWVSAVNVLIDINSSSSPATSTGEGVICDLNTKSQRSKTVTNLKYNLTFKHLWKMIGSFDKKCIFKSWNKPKPVGYCWQWTSWCGFAAFNLQEIGTSYTKSRLSVYMTH